MGVASNLNIYFFIAVSVDEPIRLIDLRKHA